MGGRGKGGRGDKNCLVWLCLIVFAGVVLAAGAAEAEGGGEGPVGAPSHGGNIDIFTKQKVFVLIFYSRLKLF